METCSDTIIDTAIEDETKESCRETVLQFVHHVQHRVKQKTKALQEEHGDAVHRVVDEALSDVISYRQAKEDLFRPSDEITDAKSEGAAAWYEPSTQKTAFDDGAMERTIDTGYWNRTGKHEHVHETRQAVEFNRSSLTFGDETISVHPTLIEWQAITESGQIDADLSLDYIHHRRAGNRLAAFLGSVGPITTALQSGDMEGLQDVIDEKDAERKSMRHAG
jgi:hypothetical protein